MGTERIEYMKKRFKELEKQINPNIPAPPPIMETSTEEEITELIPRMDTLREYDKDVRSSRLGLNSDEV